MPSESTKFPGGTTETFLEEMDNLITKKPDCLIIPADTNDLTKGVSSLSNLFKKS